MKLYLFIFTLISFCGNTLGKEHHEFGVLWVEQFGAKGDGVHDDTDAIQAAIDSINGLGGGGVCFGKGKFLVTTIKLGAKTSIRGMGNGATVIQQKSGTKDHCLVVSKHSAALKISDFTLFGKNSNCGIYFEDSSGKGEHHEYLIQKESINAAQGYKWINVDNVCVYHFDSGIMIEKRGYDINISNSTISHNGDGVVMKCTDSSIYNCYITNNSRNGLVFAGSNNKATNIKSIFNGKKDAAKFAAIVVNGSRCQITNCETQDNYCKGFLINGQYNLISNCMSNTDGYCKEPKGYDPKVKACGFMIKGLYNSFSNCAVTNYNEKYGVVYHTPVMIDSAALSYYPNIFSDIKVLIGNEKLLFYEPLKNVQVLSPKNTVKRLQTANIGEECYFTSNKESANVVKGIAYSLCSLNILVDFRCAKETGRILSFVGEKEFSLIYDNKRIMLTNNNICLSDLALDSDAIMDVDDIRLMVSFSKVGKDCKISMSCYEKTATKGWIKKGIVKPAYSNIGDDNADLRIGDSGIFIKRVAVTGLPLPESVLLPYSNTDKIYNSAFVYVDADALH